MGPRLVVRELYRLLSGDAPTPEATPTTTPPTWPMADPTDNHGSRIAVAGSLVHRRSRTAWPRYAGAAAGTHVAEQVACTPHAHS